MRLVVGTRSNPARQSTVAAYANCEMQGGFVVSGEERAYVGTPAWLGTIEHLCVEMLHREPNRVEQRVEDLVDEASSLSLAERRDPLLPGQIDEIAEGLPKVVEHVTNYVELGWFDFHHRGLIGVEVPFRAKLGRWWVRGTVDLLHEPVPGLLRMVDLKTGIPSTAHSRAANLQLPLYAAGIWRGEVFDARREEWARFNRRPDVAVLFESKRLERYKRAGRRGEKCWEAGELKGDPSAQVFVGLQAIERAIDTVDEACARLNGLYHRGPKPMQLLRTGLNTGACHRCGYRRQCGVELPGHFETDQDLIEACERTFALPMEEV